VCELDLTTVLGCTCIDDAAIRVLAGLDWPGLGPVPSTSVIVITSWWWWSYSSTHHSPCRQPLV